MPNLRFLPRVALAIALLSGGARADLDLVNAFTAYVGVPLLPIQQQMLNTCNTNTPYNLNVAGNYSLNCPGAIGLVITVVNPCPRGGAATGYSVSPSYSANAPFILCSIPGN